MNIDEAHRIINGARNPMRAEARIRSRLRREARSQARAEGISLKRVREKKLKEAVDSAFDDLRMRVTGRI